MLHHVFIDQIQYLETAEVELSASGFYRLDKSFIISLLGMSVTYAVILLQTSLDSKS